MMFCPGNSFATVVACAACVLIYIMPIKTTHRSAREVTRSPGAEGREEALGSGENNTELAGNGTSDSKDTTKSPGKRVNVKAMRMSALWPKTSDGYVVISYFLAGYPLELQPDASYVSDLFKYISDKLCVRFEPMLPQTTCYYSVTKPTICVKADDDSDACFSNDVGFDAEAASDGEPQLLNVPTQRCPFHEGVQSVTRLLGLLPEHRRSDRDDTLKVMVTASGTDRLLFSQGQTAPCSDYEDDSALDLLSVSGFDTSASTLRHGSVDGIRSIEHGMVVGVRNIRHQWMLDYKRQRSMGLSFHDQRDLVWAYGCQEVWGCGGRPACENGGFRDRRCRCVCQLGFGGEMCSERTLASDEDPLTSNCSTLLRSQSSFTLAEIGLEFDGSTFYACDVTLVPPGCMRTLLQVNTSSLRPLKTETNLDYVDSNWCELYFTLLLKHSALGWRTFCLDYFFNEETLLFMSHSSIEQTYGYMKMHIPRRSLFPMIANIVFNVTFVEVPECSKKGVHERGGAVIKIHSYTVMTAVFCYLAGVMLGVVGWIVVRGLCMTNHEECPSRDGTPASSADSLGTPPPTPLSGAVLNPAPPPPAVIATPEIRTSPPDPSSAPPGTQPPPVDHPGDRPGSRLPPAGERSPRPPTAGRPPPTQQLRLPPVGGQQQQRLSPRHAGLRASFVQWGGAALDSLRAPFVGAGRAARGESRPPPQQGGSRPPQQPRGGSRPSAQGGPRPPPHSGLRPPGARQQSKYKTSPSRPAARRAPP